MQQDDGVNVHIARPRSRYCLPQGVITFWKRVRELQHTKTHTHTHTHTHRVRTVLASMELRYNPASLCNSHTGFVSHRHRRRSAYPERPYVCGRVRDNRVLAALVRRDHLRRRVVQAEAQLCVAIGAARAAKVYQRPLVLTWQPDRVA